MITDIRGHVWIFGDNIDTDVIISGKYLSLDTDEAKIHALEAICPNFSRDIKHGDVIVGGRNFGCGSSRENAPLVLKALGVGAVVAESVARIFYRNSIAIGLPALICPGVRGLFQAGDEVRISFGATQVSNLTRAGNLTFSPFSKEVLPVLERGGIDNLLHEMKLRNELLR
jgi:3-isopropylmalate dehydratase small subunit